MEVEVDTVAVPDEEEIRQRITREREVADAERAARDKELEEESARLDKLIEQEIRGEQVWRMQKVFLYSCFAEMTEEEKIGTFAAPEFLDFVEHSTKIIQRALNDNYDYVRDYTIGAETGP